MQIVFSQSCEEVGLGHQPRAGLVGRDWGAGRGVKWFPRARPASCGHGLRGGCGVGTPLLSTLRSNERRHFCMLAFGTRKCQGLLRSFRSSWAHCCARWSVPVLVDLTDMWLAVGVRQGPFLKISFQHTIPPALFRPLWGSRCYGSGVTGLGW